MAIEPPRDATPQLRQTAKLLNIFLIAIAALTIPTILIVTFTSGVIRLETLIPALAIAATAVLLRTLLTRGYIRAAALLLNFIYWGLLATIAYLGGGGIRNVAFISMLFVILTAGLTLGTTASIVASVASIALGVLLTWNEYAGWLPVDAPSLTATNDWAYLAGIIPLFALMPLLVWITRRSFAQTIEQVHQTEAYRTRTAELEETVDERTAELQASLQRERQLADDLRLALVEESRLRELQSQIIDLILHEFRTPLTVTNTALDMLYEFRDRLTPEQAQATHGRGTAGIFALARMLDETAVVAQTDTERIDIQPRTIQLRDLLVLLQTSLDRTFADRHANLQWKTTADPHLLLTQDAYMLSNILTALIDNAIKYSPKSPDVWIACHVNTNRLTFQIRDQGIGIPSTAANTIGNLFVRCQNARFVPGLGLGLYIAQRRVEALGGTLTINSPGEHQGTTAVLTVPTHIQTTPPPNDDSRSDS